MPKYTSITREIEFQSISGRYHNAEIEIFVAVVDEGIGPYEFWGNTGIQHDYQIHKEVRPESKCNLIRNEIHRPISLKKMSIKNYMLLSNKAEKEKISIDDASQRQSRV